MKDFTQAKEHLTSQEQDRKQKNAGRVSKYQAGKENKPLRKAKSKGLTIYVNEICLIREKIEFAKYRLLSGDKIKIRTTAYSGNHGIRRALRIAEIL